MRRILLSAWFAALLTTAAQTQPLFTIARLQYEGGGDWYSDPSSLPNLLRFLKEHTQIDAAEEEARVKIMDEELFSHPYLYMTGHGNIAFATAEVARLRHYLEGGGFLHADDNYGMDESFRREMHKVFPNAEWVELPPDHRLFSCHFKLPDGLPKVHEHDGKRPQALALFIDERLAVLYTYEADLGDGWEDPHVHDDPEEKRLAALKMGANIAVWALSH
ncbi:MAG: DUF4159 domain-containing protein [Candidatus Latescibacterota bacterium]|nr:DUF4159 domain-containing protein [Candidatus Latescibacterota bacterium]